MLRGAEEGAHRNRHQVDDVQQRAHDEHAEQHQLPGLHGAQHQIPLAPGAAQGWQTDDAERAEQKRHHGDGHAPADAGQLADLGLVRGHQDRAGAEEQRDLAEGVHGDVHARADDAPGVGQHRTEHDVRKLTDRRVGESRLEVVFAHGNHRSEDDGGTGHVGDPATRADVGQQVDAEDVDRHLEDGEHAGLDHRHRVQQRAHRRRRHHGGGQPAVEGHDRGLADAEHVERKQHGNDAGRGLVAQDTAGGEVERAGQRPGPYDRDELKTDGGAEQQAEVDAPGAARLCAAAVGDQRVGGKRQHLVEDEQREHVGGQRDAHGAGDGDGEADVEARLVLLVVAAHVADRVERGDDPQQARHQREQHAEGLHLERDGQPGQGLDQHQRRAPPRLEVGEHRQHGEQQPGGAGQGDALAKVRPAAGRGNRQRAHGRDQQRQREGERAAHGTAPMRITAARRATSTVRSVSMPR